MKIIATDYDGTLNHNGINDAKKTAISKWRKQGNLFGVVSGRGIRSLLAEIDDKDFEYDFLITNNGSVVFDNKLNIISEHRCEGKIAKPFIEDLLNWGCLFANIDKDISIMVRHDNEECKGSDIPVSRLPVISYFNQINTALKTFEDASLVTEKIRKKYGEMLNPLQNGVCIDIVPAGVDKATGIYNLLEAFNGSFKDVITVGDNINDEAMIKEFRSYAMANGVDRIKELADGITAGITELIYNEL